MGISQEKPEKMPFLIFETVLHKDTPQADCESFQNIDPCILTPSHLLYHHTICCPNLDIHKKCWDDDPKDEIS